MLDFSKRVFPASETEVNLAGSYGQAPVSSVLSKGSYPSYRFTV